MSTRLSPDLIKAASADGAFGVLVSFGRAHTPKQRNQTIEAIKNINPAIVRVLDFMWEHVNKYTKEITTKFSTNDSMDSLEDIREGARPRGPGNFLHWRPLDAKGPVV